MFQKFNTESMFTNFIKHLLATTSIPTLQCINQGTPIIAGCTYKYGDVLIRATKSGKFDNALTDSFEIIYSNCTESNFVSNVIRYDEDTHKHLGNYLRYIRDTTDLNLMNYYNCYSNKEIPNIVLRSSTKKYRTVGANSPKVGTLNVGETISQEVSTTYTVGKKNGYRLIAVPVLYDKQYTVALSCPDSVLVRGFIYNQGNVIIDKISNITVERQQMKDFYSDYLEHTFMRVPFSDFNSPFTFKVSLFDHKFNSSTKLNDLIKQELYSQQRNLHMVIQIPEDIETSIVVLEDYNPSSGPLSLLSRNTGTSYAFSDRLIEYLMLNVVHYGETLPGNIQRCKEALSKLGIEHGTQKGIWENSITNSIKQLLYENSRWLENPFDQDGNMNKDVEQLLSNIGVYST